ncbi:single-stranded-DNA-specific exonuclease RecJ [Mesoterricola sediminis]|uniref:Single-stranded-DNA-specific exonuclease RecJ n=1 Tax=Mesoterricola sediminis TaxID=2927980 RepID=A0AA48KCC0_9BACT|nr:DHH family phosphoesterase [Mesoterricola sediminis]BDU76999.1 hypothetical protein METESE_19570 [Mesoterricola sediminis]
MNPLPWRLRRAHLTSSDPWRPLADRFGLSLEAARLAWLRNADAEELAWRLDPDLGRATDPFLLPGVAAAARQLREAIDRKARICVYGDYDVDGVTATALLTRVLASLGAQVDFFIPNRFSDGYGLNQACIQDLVETRRPELLVSVDCGVRSAAEVAASRDLGVAWIITDHHALGDTMPDCTVVHPGLDAYPNPWLSGVGVAFKLAQAVAELSQGGPAAQPAFLRALLKLVALGTIADKVPLLGENALLVKEGLAALGGPNAAGLAALLRMAKVEAPLRARDVAFRLGPRLNAVGRMGGAEDAVRLLLSKDPEEAEALAARLEGLNAQRRAVQEDLAAALPPPGDAPFDLVVCPGAHKGVLGIVAGQRARTYNRPSAVCTVVDGVAQGSARAPEGYDLMRLLEEAKPFLRTFGGHRQAAGLTFDAGRETFLRRALNLGATAQAGAMGPAVLAVDGRGLAEVPDAAELDRLEPFGQGFPEPVFQVEGEVDGAFRSFKGVHRFKLKGVRSEFTVFGEAPPPYAGRVSLAVSPQDSLRWPRAWRVEGELDLAEAP